MLNAWEFIGNLGNDPEAKSSKSGVSYTNFSVAVNKRGAKGEDKPIWVNVTAFGKTGENATLYLKKGSTVFVRGSLELQEYEGKDGQKHASLSVAANEVVYLSKKEGTEKTASAGATTSAKAAAATDEDIPF